MILLEVILYIVLAISILIICINFKIQKQLNYANPFFYFLSFSILYFGIPAIFVEDIKHYYDWSFSEQDMIFSNILVVLIIVIFTFLFYKFRHISLKNDVKIKASIIIKLIWWFILFYLIYVITLKLQSGQLFFNTDYLGTEDIYKLKNIAYLLITVSVLYYSENKSFFVFIPNILVAILDMLEGSRTTAFIVLIPIFISLAIYKKKTYLSWIALLLSIMILVGIFRSEYALNQYAVPTHISALGEFRETYILLPNIISNEKFVGKGNIENIMSSISIPFLQPLRGELSKAFDNSGSYAARLIGRGYGLGNNFLVESIYYGYLFIFFNIIFVILYLYMLYFLIKKINLVYAIILISYSVIFIRLIIREGFISNFTLMVFILLFYMLPFLLINKYFKKIRFRSREK